MPSKIKTTVGGQAVMEGVMMQGPEKLCLAVRAANGEIITEIRDTAKRPWAKLPIIRGIFNFIQSLTSGYKTLMRSAELSMGDMFEEEEPSKLDKWISEKFGEKGEKVIFGISSLLGVVLALALFMVLPTSAVGLLNRFVELGAWKALIEGVIKIVLFVTYIALVRRMKEIKRVFSYHGAEHKTIACYEAGEELTVANIRTKTRFHPRCGTSFLLIVMVISILLFSILPWTNIFMRVGLKLLSLPVVMGLAYEIIRLAGRYDNIITRIVSAPGLLLQRLTTEEPEDAMIEVAIAAVLPVLPEKPEEAKW